MRRILSLSLLSLLGTAPAWANCHEHEGEEEGEKGTTEELPAAVREAIAARWPGSTVLSAERERGRYEVQLREADGAKREVTLTAAGQLREDEREESEEDD